MSFQAAPTDIAAYKLGARGKKLLARFDQLVAALAAGGRKPSAFLLHPNDYRDWSQKVRDQSDKRLTIHDVNYKGYPIQRHESAVKVESMDLFS